MALNFRLEQGRTAPARWMLMNGIPFVFAPSLTDYDQLLLLQHGPRLPRIMASAIRCTLASPLPRNGRSFGMARKWN